MRCWEVGTQDVVLRCSGLGDKGQDTDWTLETPCLQPAHQWPDKEVHTWRWASLASGISRRARTKKKHLTHVKHTMHSKIRFNMDLEIKGERTTCNVWKQTHGDTTARKKKPSTPALYFSLWRTWAAYDLPISPQSDWSHQDQDLKGSGRLNTTPEKGVKLGGDA